MKQKLLKISILQLIQLKICCQKKNFEVEYVEIRNQELEKIDSSNLNSKLVLLASVKIGATKLIDNIEFN